MASISGSCACEHPGTGPQHPPAPCTCCPPALGTSQRCQRLLPGPAWRRRDARYGISCNCLRMSITSSPRDTRYLQQTCTWHLADNPEISGRGAGGRWRVAMTGPPGHSGAPGLGTAWDPCDHQGSWVPHKATSEEHPAAPWGNSHPGSPLGPHPPWEKPRVLCQAAKGNEPWPLLPTQPFPAAGRAFSGNPATSMSGPNPWEEEEAGWCSGALWRLGGSAPRWTVLRVLLLHPARPPSPLGGTRSPKVTARTPHGGDKLCHPGAAHSCPGGALGLGKGEGTKPWGHREGNGSMSPSRGQLLSYPSWGPSQAVGETGGSCWELHPGLHAGGSVPPPPSQNPCPLGRAPCGCCVLTSGSLLNGRKEILILGKGWTRPFPPAAVGRGTRHRHTRHPPVGPSQQSHPQMGPAPAGRYQSQGTGWGAGRGGSPSPPDPQDPLGGSSQLSHPETPGRGRAGGSAGSPSRSGRPAAPVMVLGCGRRAGAVRGRGPGGLSCSPAPTGNLPAPAPAFPSPPRRALRPADNERAGAGGGGGFAPGALWRPRRDLR